MGIRMTQFIGLTREADEFLEKNCIMVADKKCPNCNHILSYTFQEEKYDEANGMFDGVPLFKYYLKDGRTIKSVEQCSPWSSGPVIFLCLEDEKGNRMFEWTEQEIYEIL